MIKVLESPLLRQPRPWWIPLVTLAMTLYGILVQDWNLFSVVFLFWWEVLLMLGTALIRMFTALDNRPANDLIAAKLGLLVFGVIMGGAMLLLTVTFTIKATDGGSSGAGNIGIQSKLMTVAYLMGLIVHFFLNGRYKTANPGSELMFTFGHLLVILAPLMVVTMHFLPAHPEWNQARWVAVAIVSIKFVVDWLFNGIRRSGPLTQPDVEGINK